MKRVIALIFLFVITSCSGSSPEVDQQGGNTIEAENATTDIESCDALESFDQCPGSLPMELMDIEQELLEEVGPDSVPYMQRNYLLNCVSRSDTSIDRNEIAATCHCLYQGLVDHLRTQGTEIQAVRWFIELEDSATEGNVPPAWAMEVFIACA